MNVTDQKTLYEIQTQCSTLINELDRTGDIIKRHILILDQYDGLKDIAFGLVRLIANQRSVKIEDILEEMKREVPQQ